MLMLTHVHIHTDTCVCVQTLDSDNPRIVLRNLGFNLCAGNPRTVPMSINPLRAIIHRCYVYTVVAKVQLTRPSRYHC